MCCKYKIVRKQLPDPDHQFYCCNKETKKLVRPTFTVKCVKLSMGQLCETLSEDLSLHDLTELGISRAGIKISELTHVYCSVLYLLVILKYHCKIRVHKIHFVLIRYGHVFLLLFFNLVKVHNPPLPRIM